MGTDTPSPPSPPLNLPIGQPDPQLGDAAAAREPESVGPETRKEAQDHLRAVVEKFGSVAPLSPPAEPPSTTQSPAHPPLPPSPSGTSPTEEAAKRLWDAALQEEGARKRSQAQPLPPTSSYKAPDVPHIRVEVAPGKGYEWMIRRVWEELQGSGLNPNNYPVGSDLHRLLIADEKSIDRISHLIAVDQKHQFFGGASAVAPSGTALELGDDGDVHVIAPASGVGTPRPPTPQVVAPQPPPPTVSVPVPEPIAVPPPPQAAVQPEPAAPFSLEQPVRIETAAASAAPAPAAGQEEPFTNRLNIPIDPTKGAVYLDTNGAAIAYGTTFATRIEAAKEYAKAHRGVVVWVQAEHPTLYEGVMHPWALPVSYRGLLGGFDIPQEIASPEQLGTINPHTFTKQL